MADAAVSDSQEPNMAGYMELIRNEAPVLRNYSKIKNKTNNQKRMSRGFSMLNLVMIRDNFAPSSDTSSEISPNSEMADSTTSRPIYELGGCLQYKTPYRYFERLLLSNFEPSCSTSGKRANDCKYSNATNTLHKLLQAHTTTGCGK